MTDFHFIPSRCPREKPTLAPWLAFTRSWFTVEGLQVLVITQSKGVITNGISAIVSCNRASIKPASVQERNVWCIPHQATYKHAFSSTQSRTDAVEQHPSKTRWTASWNRTRNTSPIQTHPSILKSRHPHGCHNTAEGGTNT
jgi:hypothetical protein